jgi:ATP-dependent Clp protease ATP-binding subunit ClpA
VLRAAEQECRNRNHYYVGVEHILMALLEERDPLIELRLAALGIRSDDVHAEVRRVLGTGEDRVWDGILLTPRLRSIVELAGTIAGDAPVEPSHLFTAIMDEGGGCAAELLRRLAAAQAGGKPNADTGQGVTAWNI